jgi:hypothetical protein
MESRIVSASSVTVPGRGHHLGTGDGRGQLAAEGEGDRPIAFVMQDERRYGNAREQVRYVIAGHRLVQPQRHVLRYACPQEVSVLSSLLSTLLRDEPGEILNEAVPVFRQCSARPVLRRLEHIGSSRERVIQDQMRYAPGMPHDVGDGRGGAEVDAVDSEPIKLKMIYDRLEIPNAGFD